MVGQGQLPPCAAILRAAVAGGVIAAALSACGSSREAGGPNDPVAAAAWREWRRFGQPVISYVGGTSRNGGVHETQEPLASRIGDYWRVAGHPEWNGRNTERPWSGAFVSWTMREGGVSPRDLPPNGRHAGFLAVLLDAQLQGRGGAFRVHDWRDYTPKSGDLVCAGVRANGRRDARALRAAVDREVTHCDVVIDNAGGGQLRAVGGNVRDSVTMSVYPVDGSGRLLDVGRRPWFAVVEKRG